MSEPVPVGKLIEGEAFRDAIHVAIAPVVATQTLRPGEEVGFVNGDGESVGIGNAPVGIVDPFLVASVRPGQRFYVFLFPNTVTGMRHHWSHPAFDAQPPAAPAPAMPPAEFPARGPARDTAANERWLEDYCRRNDCPPWSVVREALESGRGFRDYGDGGYLHFDGYDAHGEIPDEFWEKAEDVIGRPLSRAGYRSCSC